MPPKKCTSICTKKKTVDECNTDARCKYANGKIRKYCHLSSKYTFDNLCNIIYKNKPVLPSTVKLPSSNISPSIVMPYVKKTRKTKKKITKEKLDITPIYNEKVSPLDKPIDKPIDNIFQKVYKSIKRKPFTIIDSTPSNKSEVKVPIFSKMVEVPSKNKTPTKVEYIIPKKKRKTKKIIKIKEPTQVEEPIQVEEQIRVEEPVRVEEPIQVEEPIHVEEPIQKRTSSRTRKATKLISNLLFKKRDKIRSNFLNTICSDSGFCIALGKEDKLINAFFDYFISFKYAISPVSTIGKESRNGFIKEIIYEREKYKSYAVLKSQQADNVSSDSLIYEFFVGQYINTLTTRFPLFVKTYGLLKYTNAMNYIISKDNNILYIEDFKKMLKPVLDIDDTVTDFSYLCNREVYLNCLLIEHLKNPIYIENICRIGRKDILTQKENYELNFELPNILYQIYFVLSCIYHNFTHYDLHYNNVLLYKPKEFGYLTYHYHTTDKPTIIFDSQYIAKIIDYGRCFYKYNEERNSNSFFERLCSSGLCGSRCGERYGFSYIGLPPVSGRKQDDHFINRRKRNASHDLRFADLLKTFMLPWLEKYKQHNNTKKLLDILNKIQYKEFYGTPEDLKIVTYTKRNVIRNIIQLKKGLDVLIQEINKLPSSTFLRTTASYTKLGDLHIYDDGRPMVYEAVVL